MRRILALAPEFSSLRHTEAVLFINNSHTEVQKLHLIFYDSVCSDDNIYTSVHETSKYFLAFLAFHNTSQQFYAKVHTLEKLLDSLQVLFSKYLRRCHHACLIAVIDGYEHRHKGYECLTRAYIALQETIHLLARHHICAYFMHHSLLCTSKFKGQVMRVEPIKLCSNAIEDIAPILAPMVTCIAKNIELNIEKFLKFKADTCPLRVINRLRIMYLTHGSIVRDEV